MSTQITNYKCPACTGPLHFDGNTGKVICDYCGSTYAIAEIEELYGVKDEAAIKAAEEAEAKAAKEGNPDIWEYTGEQWGKEAAGMKLYNCPSCGAEIICDSTTGATSCPYCGNPTMVPGTFTGAFKPELVIPFKIQKEQAIAALKNHYKNKPLLPPEFEEENHIKEIKGVYVPFWLFNGTADVDMTFETSISHVHETGNEKITETDMFHVRRAGTVTFENIPVDASTKMPDEHMDAIEPFDYSELKPFSMAYLTGFMADKYDVSVDDAAPRADERSAKSAVDTVRGTVDGYTSTNMLEKSLKLNRGKVTYALMPVWLLSTRWNDQSYLFAMNGQTGKLIGDLPISEKRSKQIQRQTFIKVAAGLTVVFGLLSMFFL